MLQTKDERWKKMLQTKKWSLQIKKKWSLQTKIWTLQTKNWCSMNLRHLQLIFIASSNDFRWVKRLSGERSKYGASFFARKWCVYYALEPGLTKWQGTVVVLVRGWSSIVIARTSSHRGSLNRGSTEGIDNFELAFFRENQLIVKKKLTDT